MWRVSVMVLLTCFLLLPAANGGAYTTRVQDHGAVGDGATDDTAAFQAALDACAAKGGVVHAPVGTYLIAGTLSIPQGVTLRGVWEAPHHADIGKGTLLYSTANKDNEDGEPFIMLHQSSAVRGLTIVYPEQEMSAVHAYPWCIRGRGMHCSVIDVTLVNPYKGIDFGTHNNELHLIRNIFGQPLKTGIYINNTTDIGRVENVHFNPHSWMRADLPADLPSAKKDWGTIVKYLNENFVGFVIGKTDWEYMRDCFCIFPKIGFHFIHTENGDPNVVLTQCGADICPVAVRVDACQEHAGLGFVNGQFMGTFIIGPDNRGPVKLTNCGFWTIDQTNEQVIVDGNNTMTLNACHFHDWARADASSPCIRVRGGAALIQSCDFFQPEKTQILIEKDAQAVTVIGCRLRHGERIENNAPNAQVEKGLNLTR